MNKISREKVVENSLKYLGTRWRHGARIKDVGIDCTGLVIMSLNDSGADIPDNFKYLLQDEFPKLVKVLNKYCDKVSRAPLPGDIVLFRGKDMFNHVGIHVKENKFIHAYSAPAVMAVVLQPYSSYWEERLKGVYAYKGFEN